MKFSRIALLGAATLAVAQPHHHAHRHVGKRGSPVEARGASVTTTVAGPVVTVYKLNGVFLSWADVEAGISSGKYVLVGDQLSSAQPTAAPTPATSAPATSAPSTTATPTPSSIPSTSLAPTPSSSSILAAQFVEIASTSTTPSSTPVAATTSPKAAVTTATSSSSSSSSSGTGLTASFPNGATTCDTFPSAYGAVYIDWLNLSGWTGVQNVPGYTKGQSISDIVTGSGGCTKNSFCSYACPAGYQKSQWPTDQGSTGQSVGGLYCNSEGYLELSRDVSQLCIAGSGNVQVQNTLSKNVAICRTDYPGTESETIPLNTEPGQTYEVTCPIASEYYIWEGKSTSAQYYINPSGASVEDACQWGSAGTNLGNWAPVNMGVGTTSAGTFISLFPNSPTNPDGTLDFNIAITGGVSGTCEYKNGQYYNDGVVSATGCTVGVTGTALFVFS
ncbi:hypothetical protein G7Y89_g2918 [Cudoniella acicularis]|uniref:Uncharacterized protein n=1 Tax=Cudoniella acicularis TaxID=354080 RepID=A0A8H4RSG2_9HELO|nr:hypothetical protein G7Y89_g2918 [Cudoniella acicularis]